MKKLSVSAETLLYPGQVICSIFQNFWRMELDVGEQNDSAGATKDLEKALVKGTTVWWLEGESEKWAERVDL